MKIIFRAIAVLSMLALPLAAQAQGSRTTSGGQSGGRDSGATSGAATVSAPPVSSGRDASASSDSARTTTAGSYVGGSSGGSYGSFGSSTYSAPAIRLQGTSFYSYRTYNEWYQFLNNLRFMYTFYADTSRFMRNTEPLITPQFAFLAARRPLLFSVQILTIVDELSSLLADARAGKPVNRKEIEANTRQLRVIAKAIRTDQSLAFVDLRADKDLFKGVDVDQLGLDAIERLREIAVDLNLQLKNMARQSEHSTISVDYLTRPSFVSLSKGIEKLSRVIENSARRM